MAHFARLDENNIVTQVIAVANWRIKDSYDVEQENLGVAFCRKVCNDEESNWVQTSYNRSIRGHFAGVGFSYDEDRDAFIPPKPFPSWVLNEDNLLWNPPVPYSGEDMMSVVWDEDAYQADNTAGWVSVTS